MDVFNNTETQPRDEIFEMGKEFAFEGLTEEYFKANNEDELERFRKGELKNLKRIYADRYNIKEDSTN